MFFILTSGQDLFFFKVTFHFDGNINEQIYYYANCTKNLLDHEFLGPYDSFIN